MQFHRKQGASARPSTRVILTLFVITCALPLIGTFARSRRSHRAAGDDAPAKTSQALTPSRQRLAHVKSPDKSGANPKETRKTTGSETQPGGIAGQ